MQFNLSGESIRPIPTISLFLGCRCNNCLPPWIWSKLLGLCNPIQHFVLCWNIQSAVMFLCIKYINVLCSLYLMTEDDQMNSGSCMLSLTVCLIPPAAVSDQCVLVLIASRLSGWWPPTWFITAIVLQLKLLPNPQTRPCTRSWPPSKTDRVSPFMVASSWIMLKLTSVSGQTESCLSVFCLFTVGLQRSRSWCCQVEWARPSRPPSSSTPTSWRGTQTFSSCSSKTCRKTTCFYS